MFGSNLKVHFAGSDNGINDMIALHMADVHYNLFSCYPFIKTKRLTDEFRVPENKVFVPRINQGEMKHVIMDSGLFTLMFGAGKEQKASIESLTEWQDKTARFVNEMKEKHEGNEGFKSRAIMSSLVGNFVDSFVFNPLAFYGIMPVKTMLITIVTYAIAKTVYESICVPLTDLVVRKVQKYELRCY